MKLITAVALALSVALTAPAFAQEKKPADTNMQILRDKIKADKKLVVAANMNLSDAQAKKFWPIYDAYQKELEGLNRRIAKVIVEYAEADQKGAMTDALAAKLINESIKIEQDEAAARKRLAGKLGKALPGKVTARYLQIESKIRAAIRYELAADIPLVE
jgi:Spy/CpxP family protein refolding chaperone